MPWGITRYISEEWTSNPEIPAMELRHNDTSADGGQLHLTVMYTWIPDLIGSNPEPGHTISWLNLFFISPQSLQINAGTASFQILSNSLFSKKFWEELITYFPLVRYGQRGRRVQ
jgi:hypothetical protein